VRDAALSRALITREAAAALSEREILELLFVHGFSTRAQVNDLSGRGVGLDVVRGAVEALGGSAWLDSIPSQGTQVALTLPAAIGKERLLIIDCGDVLYGLPSRNVLEVLHVASAPSEMVAGGRVIRHRDAAIPLRSFGAAMRVEAADEETLVLVLLQGSAKYAFTVPALLGDRELVRRPVDAVVAAAARIHASASLNDGRLVLLLTVAELLRRSEETPWIAPVARREVRPRTRVLVVDDSPIIREVVTEILRGGGMDPTPVPDGPAALSFLETNAADVAVLDVDMPGMDGFELLQRIRLRSERLPVIMLTTRASPDDRRRASSLGADAYVVKAEFLEGTLVKTVRRFAGE
jgi:CheY-like chemotaxis protein